jgi:hypothetical protein
METKAIYFDMDGTIADLYAVENWLPMLQAYNPTPYKQAKVMVNASYLARLLNKLQKQGYKIGIVSWRSKCSTSVYDVEVTYVKLQWLYKHLPSVHFDEIKIVDYGTPKSSVVSCPTGILFDDEQGNRTEWQGQAYQPQEIITILKQLLQGV